MGYMTAIFRSKIKSDTGKGKMTSLRSWRECVFRKGLETRVTKSTGCDARNSCPDCRVRIQIQEIDAAFRAAVRDEILGARL